METLKILNFIHLCFYLPKGYHNPLYRKKNKKQTLIILNRKKYFLYRKKKLEIGHVSQCLEKGKSALPQASNEYVKGSQYPCKALHFFHSPHGHHVYYDLSFLWIWLDSLGA